MLKIWGKLQRKFTRNIKMKLLANGPEIQYENCGFLGKMFTYLGPN